AKCVLQYINTVFARHMILGTVKANPAYGLQRILVAPPVQNHARISEKELPALLVKMAAHTAHAVTKVARRFLLLTLVRTGDMRFARWDEIDFAKAEWRIPAARMKMNRAHIVPLSRQAINVLEEVRRYSGGRVHVFHSPYDTGKPISENAVLYALYDMGYKG